MAQLELELEIMYWTKRESKVLKHSKLLETRAEYERCDSRTTPLYIYKKQTHKVGTTHMKMSEKDNIVNIMYEFLMILNCHIEVESVCMK